MWEGTTLIVLYSVGSTIFSGHDNFSRPARCIKGGDSLDGDIGHVEGLEHDLCYSLTVRLGVDGSLRHEDEMPLRGNTESIEEGIVQVLFHVIPIDDDFVLDKAHE